jgi:hypothetical protein
MCFTVRMRVVHSLSSGCEIDKTGAAAFVEVLEKNTTLQSLKFCECFHFRVVCGFTALSKDCFDLLCFQVCVPFVLCEGSGL